jgi:hypothetical protein
MNLEVWEMLWNYLGLKLKKTFYLFCSKIKDYTLVSEVPL